MATTYHNVIQSLYVAYFNRPADAGGLAHWAAAVEAAKGDTAAVSASFAASAEYKSTYANMTNEQIVDKVYQNLFGRSAEAEGKKYWADLMTAGKITIDAVVRDISKAAVGTDKIAFESKTAFAVAFTNAMDTDAEKAGYNADSVDEAKALVAGIKTAADLEAAIAPAALNASVAAVVKAGTPFTVLGALKSLEVAVEAKETFLAAIDGDGKATTSADETAIATGNITAAHTKIAAALTDATVYNSTTSDNVRAAIVADQIAANALALKNGQTALAAANVEVAKVAGLASAIASLSAAKDAVTNATKAITPANAELQAKLASFKVTGGTAAVNAEVAADGTVKIPGATPAEDVHLIVVSSGKLALATNVTEKTHPGITALLAASTAKEAADLSLTKATAAADFALFTVQSLDVNAADAGAEATALANIKAKMPEFNLGSAMPNVAQMVAKQQALDLKAAGGATADVNAASEFRGLVSAYRDIADNADPLFAAQDLAATAIANATKKATDLATATAALNKAKAESAQLKALNDAIDAAEEVFAEKDYHLESLDVAFEVGTGDNDIFLVGTADATISLFNLQGNDQLYVGSGYKLNKGALTTGDDTALEVFVKASGSDTVLTIETSKFGSSAADAEVVVVTLVGVDANSIQLSNGIITQSGTGA